MLSQCAKEREKQQKEESKGLERCPDCGGLVSLRDSANSPAWRDCSRVLAASKPTSPGGMSPDTGSAARPMLVVLQGLLQSASARLLVTPGGSFGLWAPGGVSFFAFP